MSQRTRSFEVKKLFEAEIIILIIFRQVVKKVSAYVQGLDTMENRGEETCAWKAFFIICFVF